MKSCTEYKSNNKIIYVCPNHEPKELVYHLLHRIGVKKLGDIENLIETKVGDIENQLEKIFKHFKLD